jgi:outer membrane lipoprotein-sorting protein
MRESRKKSLLLPWVFMMLVPLMFMACGGRRAQLEKDPFHLESSGIQVFAQNEANEVFQRINTTNSGLKAVKGVGGIKLKSEKEHFSSRLAWVAELSGKMRLEVIGPDGRPLLSLSSDGQFVYFYSHGEKKYYKKRISEKNLSDYLGIPLEPLEMTALLSGRISGLPGDRIALTKNPAEEGFVLFLFDKKSGEVTRIFLTADRQTLRKMEKRKSNGTLLYEVLFENFKTVNQFAIPFDLFITDAAGSTFQLKMNQVIDNPAIDGSLFILYKPER